jgi:F-type H+-transporting ATPase subunit gamma
MKTVSAAKLRKSVTELNKARPHLTRLSGILNRVARKLDVSTFPILSDRSEGGHLLVAISSDKGLCGAFNSHIIKQVENRYQEIKDSGRKVQLITIGNKMIRHFEKRDVDTYHNFPSMMLRLTFESACQLCDLLEKSYIQESIRSIEFIFTEFISASSQRVGSKEVFPLRLKQSEENGEDSDEDVEFILEPSARGIFEALLPGYVRTYIYSLMLESAASEHAARMIAMDLATRNADDMIRHLTLTLNKLRQASITKELLEIITATEALKM